MVTTGILGVSIYFLFLAKAFAGPEIARPVRADLERLEADGLLNEKQTLLPKTI